MSKVKQINPYEIKSNDQWFQIKGINNNDSVRCINFDPLEELLWTGSDKVIIIHNYSKGKSNLIF
jgi:hypothetical protein